MGDTFLEPDVIPAEWKVGRIGDVVEFTRKPRDLDISLCTAVPFIPMDLLPDDGLYTRQHETRTLDQLTSGVFFTNGDILLAKITPCLENGKQAIAKDMPGGWGYATTEVFPIRPKCHDTEFLAFYLRVAEVRRLLASKMQGATGRQRLPREAVENFPVPVPPFPEQQIIAYVLRTVQQAKEATEKVIAAARQLKQSLMRHLFTYGLVPFDQADQVPLKDTDVGQVPVSWREGRFDEFAVLQRGVDITKGEQRPGTIPVVSSSGIKSYHDTACVKGPGVVIGRKGSLGTAHYLESDFWPHDTTLWVKDFKGNYPKYLYYFIPMLRLELFDTGTSNPTLNRNHVHAMKTAVPIVSEQITISKMVSAVDRKIEVEEKRLQSIEDLFKTLLHNLMTGKVRVHDVPAFAKAGGSHAPGN